MAGGQVRILNFFLTLHMVKGEVRTILLFCPLLNNCIHSVILLSLVFQKCLVSQVLLGQQAGTLAVSAVKTINQDWPSKFTFGSIQGKNLFTVTIVTEGLQTRATKGNTCTWCIKSNISSIVIFATQQSLRFVCLFRVLCHFNDQDFITY